MEWILIAILAVIVIIFLLVKLVVVGWPYILLAIGLFVCFKVFKAKYG